MQALSDRDVKNILSGKGVNLRTTDDEEENERPRQQREYDEDEERTPQRPVRKHKAEVIPIQNEMDAEDTKLDDEEEEEAKNVANTKTTERKGFFNRMSQGSREKEVKALRERVSTLEEITAERKFKAAKNIAMIMVPDHGNMFDHQEHFLIERDDTTRTAIAVFRRTNGLRRAILKIKEIKVPFNDAMAFPTATGWLAFFDVKNFDQIPPTSNKKLREMVSRANKELKHIIQDIIIMNRTGEELTQQKPSWWDKYGLQFISAACIMVSAVSILYLASQLPTIGTGVGKAVSSSLASQIASLIKSSASSLPASTGAQGIANIIP